MDADELLALEAQMRAPDAVMEPGMADVVARYMRAGGKPADVIESLMAGYEGAPGFAGGGGRGRGSRVGWVANQRRLLLQLTRTNQTSTSLSLPLRYATATNHHR